jgi:hypothetical protein
MVVMQKQLHQTIEQVHSILVVGLSFMVFIDEWSRAPLGLFIEKFYYILMLFINFSPLGYIHV